MTARVLFVDNAPVIGGVQVTLRNILGSIDRTRFDPVIAVPRGSPGVAWYADASARVVEIDMPSVRGARALTRANLSVLRASDALSVELVHANSTRSGLASLLTKALRGIPLVWTVHEGHVPGAARVAGALADIRLYRSEDQRRRHRWLRSSNMRLVYCGVPDQKRPLRERATLREALREEFRFPRECPVLGTVGTLTWWKGHDVFIRASSRIAAQRDDARFVVVGGESPLEKGYSSYLAQLSNRLGLGDRLVLTSFRADAPSLIGGFDVLVHAPVFPESFGIVVADAMSNEIVPLVAALGSMTELVADGVDGRWFPARDPIALANVALELLADPKQRARLAAAGREKFERLFTIEGETRRYEQAYAELLCRERGKLVARA